MKLALLGEIAKKFSAYRTLFSVRRIEDNLFSLCLDFDEFYIDVSRGKSAIFLSEEKLLGNSYQAPFDLALNRHCARSQILACKLDGSNRILIFELLSSGGYKQERCFLHFEFTGRHTNVILINEKGKILEALRHIGAEKSARVIQPQKTFIPLPQPSMPYSLEFEGDVEQILRSIAKERRDAKLLYKKEVILLRKEKKLQILKDHLALLPNSLSLSQEAKKFALWGELIFSSKPPEYFTHSFCLKDYEGKEVEIALPHRIRTFAEAGNFCFSQSKKYKQKSKYLQIQKEYLCSKIDFLQKEIAYIRSINHQADLQVFCVKNHKKDRGIKKEYESFFIDGMKVSVGRNMKENQRLLEDAKADDLWLHLQNIPSSHMIIHCGKAKVREEVLLQSAKILLGINGILDKNIAIDYTKRRFVKMVEGSNVVYSKQNTLRL